MFEIAIPLVAIRGVDSPEMTGDDRIEVFGNRNATIARTLPAKLVVESQQLLLDRIEEDLRSDVARSERFVLLQPCSLVLVVAVPRELPADRLREFPRSSSAAEAMSP